MHSFSPAFIVRALFGAIVILALTLSSVTVAVVNGLHDASADDATAASADRAPQDAAAADGDASPSAPLDLAPLGQGPLVQAPVDQAPVADAPDGDGDVRQSVPAVTVPAQGMPIMTLPGIVDGSGRMAEPLDVPPFIGDDATDAESPAVPHPRDAPVAPAAPMTPVTPAAPVAPVADDPGRIAVGISTDGVPSAARIEKYRHTTGTSPAVVGWFLSWGDPLGWRDQLDVVARSGAVPMIAIDPARDGRNVPLQDIAAGTYDDYIASLAAQAREHGDPLLFRFGHEMNLPSIEWQLKENTPDDFVAAWRHMVGIFRAQHADNVRWVWSPNADCMGGCPFADFYPGDAYVDWVGLDVYNFADGHGTPWHSLGELLTSSYRSMTRLTDKPMMLSEISSIEEGGDKAAWIRSALTDIPEKFPAVQAIVWWDRDDGAGQDYRFDSSPSARDAFLELLRTDSYGSVLPPDGR